MASGTFSNGGHNKSSKFSRQSLNLSYTHRVRKSKKKLSAVFFLWEENHKQLKSFDKRGYTTSKSKRQAYYTNRIMKKIMKNGQFLECVLGAFISLFFFVNVTVVNTYTILKSIVNFNVIK